MKTNNDKSIEITSRLTDIQAEIDLHQNNILLLKSFAKGEATLKGKGYTDSASRYERTIADNNRLPATIENLRWQILILERERKVLMQYGS